MTLLKMGSMLEWTEQLERYRLLLFKLVPLHNCAMKRDAAVACQAEKC